MKDPALPFVRTSLFLRPVSSVSNPIPGRNPVVFCRRAHHVETKTALRLILGSHGRLASEVQVLDFLRFAVQRRIDVGNLWIAESAGRILWAILPVYSPGRTVLLFSPQQARDQQQYDAARELVEVVSRESASAGVHLAQVLLDPDEPAAQDLYVHCDFVPIASLDYLQASTRRRAAAPQLPEGFSLRTYSPQAHKHFADAIVRSYADSLDCPALNGLRDVEDVIAGHKATGDFDPTHWYLLCEADAPRGVVLLSRMPQSASMELVYLGLSPEARGRKLGDFLMAHALTAAHRAGCSSLTLAVDAANTPALRLYHRHGLRYICTKTAMMRNLRQSLQPVPSPA